jgi:hypothetical protein
MKEDHKNLLWEIVTKFFVAKKSFMVQHTNYDRLVKSYAKKQSVDRRQLQLGTREVAGLLDFKSIEELRNHHLRELKRLSHEMYRTEEITDLFDKYVSDIYHEISILKEEHYTVLTYAPAYEEGQQGDLTERDKILEEVHEFFPRKMEQVNSLFQKAQIRLEELLPEYGQDRVLVRSMYLFGDKLLKGLYKNGLVDLYKKVYTKGGAVEGFLTAARSFHESGFDEQAEQALKKAKAALKKASCSENEKKRLREEIKQLGKETAVAQAK